MQTTLISGTDEQTRKKKALKLAVDLKASREDTFVLEPENKTSAIQIAKVRELRRKLSLTPFNSPGKVAIIHQLNQATIAAQNALLKILEEPPDNTYIILTTPRAEGLLPTIVSRCQIIKIKRTVLKKDNSQSKGLSLSQGSQLLTSIFQSRVGERLVLAQNVSLSREEAVNWCRKMIITVRYMLMHKIRSTKHEIRNGSTGSPSRAKSRDNIKLPKSKIQNKKSFAHLDFEFRNYLGFRNLNFGFQLVELIKKLQKALIILQTTNTNPRLLIENLLLEFPKR